MSEENEKRKAEELTELKFEALNKFSRGVAHDLNNILTGLAGNITLASMYMEADPENAAAKLRDAEESIERAREFSSYIVALTQGESTFKIKIPVEAFLQQITAAAMNEGDAKLEVAIEEELPECYINEHTLGEAITGVIQNAVKASTGKGPVEVSATLQSITKADGLPLIDGDYILISIVDHGPGISEEDMPRIFDPYFSGDHRTKGRGLAIAYATIKEHAGHIRAQSVPGKGATFNIYIPVGVEATEEGEKIIRGSSTSAPSQSGKTFSEKSGGTGGIQMLVLNEEPILKDLLGELLSPLGYEISFVTNGKDALSSFKEAEEAGRGYRITLLDLDGAEGEAVIDLLKELKEITPGVKAIISSSNEESPIFLDHSSYGFDRTVSKPFNFGELSDKLKELSE